MSPRGAGPIDMLTRVKWIAMVRDMAPEQIDWSGKLVMTMLISRADDFGECFPSHATIAKDTSLSVRKVQRTLRELVEAGLVASQMTMKIGFNHEGVYEREPLVPDDPTRVPSGVRLGSNVYTVLLPPNTPRPIDRGVRGNVTKRDASSRDAKLAPPSIGHGGSRPMDGGASAIGQDPPVQGTYKPVHSSQAISSDQKNQAMAPSEDGASLGSKIVEDETFDPDKLIASLVESDEDRAKRLQREAQRKYLLHADVWESLAEWRERHAVYFATYGERLDPPAQLVTADTKREAKRIDPVLDVWNVYLAGWVKRSPLLEDRHRPRLNRALRPVIKAKLAAVDVETLKQEIRDHWANPKASLDPSAVFGSFRPERATEAAQ